MQREARELKGFLDKIAARPLDLATRKIFADWLDEHDEPELADEQRSFDPDLYEAKERLHRIAVRYAGGDYDGMLAGCLSGEGYCFSDDDGPYVVQGNEQFWEDVQLVGEKTLSEEHQENTPFRCAC